MKISSFIVKLYFPIVFFDVQIKVVQICFCINEKLHSIFKRFNLERFTLI